MDAAEAAYGAVTYLRVQLEDGTVLCNLLMAKSRLAPSKMVSIPRLELCACVCGVLLTSKVKDQLTTAIDECFFWTDSTIALKYIFNTDKRFTTFTGNQTTTIHNHSKTSGWHHVPTHLNPADVLSRGALPNQLSTSALWHHGPEYLTTDAPWPSNPALSTTLDDLELKRDESRISTILHMSTLDCITTLISRYSSLYKLKIAIAWILRLKKIIFKKEPNTGPLSVAELQEAEKEIIKYVQHLEYPDVIKMIKSNKAIPKNHPICRLNPVLNSDNILCVGGRMPISFMEQHKPTMYIIPKNSPLSDLIVTEYHNISHGGRDYVTSQIRSRFRIVGLRQKLRSLQCLICRRRDGQPLQQRMANLPVDRLEPGNPPFHYTGTDIFGPFLVKHGRSSCKRYGCLFTCLSSRAIHIEVLASLDTSSFINALVRFISRRNKPAVIRSDNGTNYIGADKVLKEELNHWNQNQIDQVLKAQGIQWKFNPPAASHHGGVWERVIRTIRKTLSSITREQVFDEEILSTLMCKVECLVNNRPITPVSSDPLDCEALTPNHLLLLKGIPEFPVMISCSKDYYAKRWRQAQYLTDLFWKRWTSEYFPLLQIRKKWLQEQPLLKVGDLVSVMDPALPRNQWLLAHVEKVSVSEDGLIRSAEVRTPTSVLRRPITKLCLLEAQRSH